MVTAKELGEELFSQGIDFHFVGPSEQEIRAEEEAARAHELLIMAEASKILAAKGVRLVSAEPPQLETRLVVASLLKSKADVGNLKTSSLETYRKRFNQISDRFPILPVNPEPIEEFLSGFTGETGRYKLTYFQLFGMIYKYATRRFALPMNVMDKIDPPYIKHKPIKTLNAAQVASLLKVLETLTEKALLGILLGHGWRQIEARRITAGDVRQVADNLIFCRGKERDELTPVLDEIQKLLNELAVSSLADHEPILRSRRIRNGSTQPLGEDGISQMLDRLFVRARLQDYRGHDLRRTFASLVRKDSHDEFLAMRLLRDKIPGMNDRYIAFPLPDLVSALNKYSPLRAIMDGEFNSPPSPPERNQAPVLNRSFLFCWRPELHRGSAFCADDWLHQRCQYNGDDAERGAD